MLSPEQRALRGTNKERREDIQWVVVNTEQQSLVMLAIALPVVLLAAYLIGQISRQILQKRVLLDTPMTIVLSVLGMSAGLLLGGLFLEDARPWSPVVLLMTLIMTVAILSIYAFVAARFQAPQPFCSIRELILSGESSRVEFKSSARWNIHTQKRDERIEAAIAKTVAGFLNSDGGTLLIGVDDQGSTVGLVDDFETLKKPDVDRFELWLRDYLSTTLGQNASALPIVDFTPISVSGEKSYVCRVTCPMSPRPVFLRSPKNLSNAEFWVRAGNSTRQLNVSDAAEYVMMQWPLGLAQSFGAHLRSAVKGAGFSTVS